MNQTNLAALSAAVMPQAASSVAGYSEPHAKDLPASSDGLNKLSEKFTRHLLQYLFLSYTA